MTPDALTDELCAAYCEETSLYSEVLRHVEQWPCSQDAASMLETIATLLGNVDAVEARLAPIKSAWLALNCRPPSRLAMVLDQLAGLIRTIQTHIDQARRHAERQRQELAPALDAAVQEQHRRRAYADVHRAAQNQGGSGHDA